ncbi:hypothetical protein ElyMa_001999400 [Elysia marginata]|uniref:Uncharacterized protein n=1 Tax=Elysia marginata TaxID=1093978 RepID=A0AAV4F2C6_9GAST|nr:hypothetical protein ElyMa_001999400 [Elysia marginata]
MKSGDPKVKLFKICEQILETLNKFSHGYHRPCYQTYTNLRQQKKRKADETDDHSSRKRRTSDFHGTALLPNDQCLFCQRKNKYVKRKQDVLVKCITETAKNSIMNAAEKKTVSRVLGITETSCLIAREAHYHDSCRRDYTRNISHTALPSSSDDTQSKLEASHSKAFQYICDYVQKHIIDGAITMLKEKYLTYLQSRHPQEYNPKYKT